MTTSQTSTITTSTGILGVSVVADAANHTKGAYVTLISSLSARADMVLICMHATGAAKSFLVDAAEGGAGSEIPFVDNLLHTNFGFQGTGIALLRTVSNGGRISARCQCNTGGSTLRIHAIAIQGGVSASAWSATTTIGVDLATSRGTSVTPATSPTEGAWTQLTASTAIDIDAIFVMIGDGGTGAAQDNANYYLDIGTGAASSEVERVPNILVGSNTAERHDPKIIGPIALQVSASTRVAARMRSSDATPFAYDIALLGVKYAAPAIGTLRGIVLPN